MLAVVSAFSYKYNPELLDSIGNDKDVRDGMPLIAIESQVVKEGKLKDVRLGMLPILRELQFTKLVNGVKLVIEPTAKVGHEVKLDRFKLAR